MIEFEGETERYAARNPCAITKTREGKRKKTVWRFGYTEQPPPELAVIAADFIYNVRSALDHLAATLVPSNDRDMFPIFFQGVWEPGSPGENAERAKQRRRWEALTRNMDPDAVAILRQAQPPDLGPNGPENRHGLAILNRLSNKDKHEKLLVYVGGVAEAQISYVDRSGRRHAGTLSAWESLQDDTKLDIPGDATQVQGAGTVVVVLRTTSDREGFKVPDAFREVTLRDAHTIVRALRPFDRGSP